MKITKATKRRMPGPVSKLLVDLVNELDAAARHAQKLLVDVREIETELKLTPSPADLKHPGLTVENGRVSEVREGEASTGETGWPPCPECGEAVVVEPGRMMHCGSCDWEASPSEALRLDEAPVEDIIRTAEAERERLGDDAPVWLVELVDVARDMLVG